jgi:hypothetical protein
VSNRRQCTRHSSHLRCAVRASIQFDRHRAPARVYKTALRFGASKIPPVFPILFA